MKFFSSLKNILTINFVMLAVLPILIIGMIAIKVFTAQLEKELTQRNFLLAKSIAGEVDKYLETQLNVLKQIKLIISEQQMIAPKQINSYLTSIMEVYPSIESIMLIDNDGKIGHCSPYTRDLDMTDMSGQPFFQEALKSHTPCWSSTSISVVTGQPTITLSVRTKDGVAVSLLNLAALKSISHKTNPMLNESIAIIDVDGTIIAHPNQALVAQRTNVKYLPGVQQALSGREGTYRYQFNGVEKVASAVIIPETGWVSAIILPMETVYATIRPIHKFLWSGMLLSIFFAAILSVLVLKKTLKPLAELTTHAGTIANGNYFLLPEQPQYLELQSLTRAFNTMIQAINTREEAIRQNETKYRRLHQSLMDGFIRMNISGKIMESNQAFQKIVGYDAEELPFLSHLDLTPEKWHSSERSILLNQVLSRGYSDVYEKEYRHKNGDIFPVEVRTFLLKDDKGQHEGMWAIVRDITQTKKMQEMMIQTEKMFSLGGIAAGIAHEINNPLGIVLQAAQNLSLRTQPDSAKNQETAKSLGLDMTMVTAYIKARKLDVFIEHIRSGGIRAAEIIRHMLDFTHHHSQSKHTSCDIRQIIENALLLAENDYDLKKSYDFKKLEIKIVSKENFPKIMCSKTEIEQVFLNLFRNSAQAMAESTPAVKNPKLKVRLNLINGRVRIEVEDNGPGMSPEIQRKIFEPFFTTKPPGIGTGLGLSVSYFIITKGHGGHFTVDSKPKSGTCFTIELPILSLTNG